MKKLIDWARRNPKLAALAIALLLAPLALSINYTLLILGLITAEEFATINTSLSAFFKSIFFIL